MNKKFTKGVNIFLFLLPALALFLGILIAPIILSGYYSFLDLKMVNVTSNTQTVVGWENYKYVFSADGLNLGKAIIHSLILAAVSVFIQLPISLGLALVLGRGIKGERFFLSVFFIPVLMSTIIIGQLWLKIYNPDYGLLSTFLRQIHVAIPSGFNFADYPGVGKPVECTNVLCVFKGHDHITLEQRIVIWLNDVDTSLWKGNINTISWLKSNYLMLGACIVPIIWQYVGYHMLLMYAGVKGVPTDLREAAKLDGATNGQINRYIVIPYIKPILKICVIFAVTGSLKSFDMIYALIKNQVQTAADVPGTLLYNQMFIGDNFGTGSAIAVILILLCFAFALIISAIFKKED